MIKHMFVKTREDVAGDKSPHGRPKARSSFIRSPRFRKISILFAILATLKYGPFIYFSSNAPYCAAPNMSRERAVEIYEMARRNRNLFKAAFLVTPDMVGNYFSDQFVMLAKHLTTPDELLIGTHAIFVAHGGVSGQGTDYSLNNLVNTYSTDQGGVTLYYKINPWLFLFISPAIEAGIMWTFPAPTNRRLVDSGGLISTLTEAGLIFEFDAFTLFYPNVDFLKFGQSIAEYPPFQNISVRLEMCPATIPAGRAGVYEYRILEQWKARH